MKESFSSQKCKNYPRLGTSRWTNNAALSLSQPCVSESSCHWKLESKISRHDTLQNIHLELQPSPPKVPPKMELWPERALSSAYAAAPSLLFKPGAPPPPPLRASLGQPAEQLSHSSSNTQGGGRTRLCTRQMVPALCNTLGQGRYFQKGFSFLFLYFIFSISHFILLYRDKKQMPDWPQGGS